MSEAEPKVYKKLVLAFCHAHFGLSDYVLVATLDVSPVLLSTRA